MQRRLADIQKENMLENLEAEVLEYEIAREFLVLADIKKKFGEKDKEEVKVSELKRLKQGSKTIEEFVQKFRRAARRSGYKKRLLVEEFK